MSQYWVEVVGGDEYEARSILCCCREIDRLAPGGLNHDALVRALCRHTNFVIAGNFLRYLRTMFITQHRKYLVDASSCSPRVDSWFFLSSQRIELLMLLYVCSFRIWAFSCSNISYAQFSARYFMPSGILILGVSTNSRGYNLANVESSVQFGEVDS